VIDSIERNGLVVYRHDPKASTMITSVDRPAFYQLKTMMQGVVARGTARAISAFSPYVAGKTGTSDEENDAWFVGFSNDVTIAVWMGYDNASGKRRTLGGGTTGGGVAVPIFEPVMQAAWAYVAPKAALAPPSPEAKRYLACKSVDLDSGEMQERGERAPGGRGGITECFRTDGSGRVVDTQYNLVSRGESYEDDQRGGYYTVNPNPFGFFSRRPEYEQQRQGGYYYYGNNGRTVPAPRDSWQPPGQYYGQTNRDPRVQRDPYGREYQTPQRVDPGYIWGGGRY
jgi:penicillin-binding protein 1A